MGTLLPLKTVNISRPGDPTTCRFVSAYVRSPSVTRQPIDPTCTRPCTSANVTYPPPMKLLLNDRCCCPVVSGLWFWVRTVQVGTTRPSGRKSARGTIKSGSFPKAVRGCHSFTKTSTQGQDQSLTTELNRVLAPAGFG